MASQAPLELEDGWNQTLVQRPIDGLNGLSDKAMISDKEASAGYNMVLWPGVFRGDTGLSSLGTMLPAKARICERFIQNDGTETQVAVTDDSMYIYDSGASEWQYAFTTTATTLDGAHTASDTTIDVVSAAGFSTGDRVGILLDDGTMHKTTIDSISSNEITIDDALPSDAASGKTFGQAISLSGSDSIQPDFTQVSSHDWFVVTNGVDTPFYFDGTNVGTVGGLVSEFTSFTATGVSFFSNMLWFINTTENGTNHKQRARRSDTGNPEEYGSGTAGFNDIFETPGELRAIEPLGPYLILYKASSIILGEYIGDADLLVNFRTTVAKNHGTVGPRAVVRVDADHYVLGFNGLFKYSGSFSAEPLSMKLDDLVFGPTGELGPNYDYRIALHYVENQKEIWCLLTDTDGNTTKIYRYHIPTTAWYLRQLAFNASCLGSISVIGGETWSASEGMWAEQVGPWVSTAGQGQATPIAVGNADDFSVYIYDYLSQDDVGTEPRAAYETKDFIVPNKQMRFDRFDVWLRGSNIRVEASTDSGDTWLLLGSFDTATRVVRRVLWRQFVGTRLRLRFVADMATFELHSYAFTYFEESEDTALFEQES